MRNWKTIFALERLTATPGDPFGQGQKYALGNYWQGKYRLENPMPGVPETIRRARSIQFMFEHLPLTLHPEQEFFGGAETFRCNTLPAEISETEYRAAVEAFSRCTGLRTFATGVSHTTVDYETLLSEGIGGFLRRAEEAESRFPSPDSKAMTIVLRALSDFCFRAAGHFRNSGRADAAARFEAIAVQPPETFEEGIQLVWLVFVLLEADGSRGHNALARIDQYLYRLYRKSRPSEEVALNELCHLWTKIEGLHEVTNLCIGGVRPDGSDAANELSFLMLKATGMVHSASTNLSARLHPNSGDEFLLACIDQIRTGIGFPAIFNDTNNIRMLTNLGIPLEAARDYALFGCVEPLIPGRQPAWSDGRFNLPECFLKTCAHLKEFHSFDDLMTAFRQEMRRDMANYAEACNRGLREQPPDRFPDPFLSALTRDCIGRGRDLNDGGAEFPRLHGVGMMGLGTLTDSLSAIRKLVYDERSVTPERLLAALGSNFSNDPELRLILLNRAPKYGNDYDYCDEIAGEIVSLCGRVCREFRTQDDGYFLSCMASNIQNIPAGATLGATPDGRLAGEPLSDAASPCAGRDVHGPTAFVNSIVRPDYSEQACTVVNMRFQPEMFRDEEGRGNLLAIIRRFLEGGGQEMQFNVTDNRQLEDAMKNPERYADLIVRVSGFSAFFTKLDPSVQRDIIRRTAHHGA